MVDLDYFDLAANNVSARSWRRAAREALAEFRDLVEDRAPLDRLRSAGAKAQQWRRPWAPAALPEDEACEAFAAVQRAAEDDPLPGIAAGEIRRALKRTRPGTGQGV
eukprot:5562894-Pyramimonas_sp.AAC.1